MNKAILDSCVKPGQIRAFTSKSSDLVLVYEVEGVRADVVYASGRKDSIFTGWLSSASYVVTEVID